MCGWVKALAFSFSLSFCCSTLVLGSRMSYLQQNLSKALAVSRVLKGELENWKALARLWRKRVFKNYILLVYLGCAAAQSLIIFRMIRL